MDSPVLSRNHNQPRFAAMLALFTAAGHSVQTVPRRLARLTLALVVSIPGLLPSAAFAALPTVAAPTSGSGGSGLMGTLQGYLAMAGILVGLTLATASFLVVGGGALGKFNEARQRGEWGDFAVTLIIGVILIVAVVWLANKASTIL